VPVVRPELSPRAAEHLVRDLLSQSRPGHLRLDAGALGAVALDVRIAASPEEPCPADRVALWLACTSYARGRHTSPMMAPSVTRRVAGDARLLAASLRTAGPAVAIQRKRSRGKLVENQ
jgi:hypothetical protein